MKKDSKKIFSVFVALICMVFVNVSCSSDYEQIFETITETAATGEQTVRMQLSGSVIPFDASTTRAGGSEWEWKDGAVVYIQFHTTGNDVVRGHAIYSKTNDTWDVSYSGNLLSSGTCEIYYFDGASAANKHKVEFAGTNALYATQEASYAIENSTIIVNAKLSPVTSRIRFKGAADMTIKVSGISTYNGYDADSNTMSKVDSAVTLKVANDGFTPYLYCVFADENNRVLNIVNSIDGDGISFQKAFDESVLKIGESGVLNIPTEDTNKGWTIVIPVTNISLSQKNIALDKDESITLAVDVLPLNASNKTVTWKSNDESVAIVSNGVVTAVSYGSATITVISVSDNTKTDKCEISVIDKSNGHDYVDLGLTSGLLWATCNVGASSVTANGYYYAWGETTTKNTYTEEKYTYDDKPAILPLDRDAARANWGGYWRMPSREECEELVNECTWEWTTRNGKYGAEGTSKKNGNTIFLPAAGYRESLLKENGEQGGYWSSSLASSSPYQYAYFLGFNPTPYSISIDGNSFDNCYLGRTIRPVLKK